MRQTHEIRIRFSIESGGNGVVAKLDAISARLQKELGHWASLELEEVAWYQNLAEPEQLEFS